ncbi:hypothetical protein EVAR_60056_1 [Eumeta japonica]|uniref:Uncharacterized protein n=1 Tax=Eumeta variegata TaxID=151549 RepID=A0A4C1ZLT9_EUMVA|nr:hypothetical protein EVAR_60056_1 [Eumeta japonica]
MWVPRNDPVVVQRSDDDDSSSFIGIEIQTGYAKLKKPYYLQYSFGWWSTDATLSALVPCITETMLKLDRRQPRGTPAFTNSEPKNEPSVITSPFRSFEARNKKL